MCSIFPLNIYFLPLLNLNMTATISGVRLTACHWKVNIIIIIFIILNINIMPLKSKHWKPQSSMLLRATHEMEASHTINKPMPETKMHPRPQNGRANVIFGRTPIAFVQSFLDVIPLYSYCADYQVVYHFPSVVVVVFVVIVFVFVVFFSHVLMTRMRRLPPVYKFHSVSLSGCPCCCCHCCCRCLYCLHCRCHRHDEDAPITSCL